MTEFKLSDKRKELFEKLWKDSLTKYEQDLLIVIEESINNQDKEFIRLLKEDIKNDKRLIKMQIPFIWDKIDKLTGDLEQEKEKWGIV